MGLIKATTSSVGGGLAGQWLEVIESDNMGDTTVMIKSVLVRKDDKRGSNRKGTDDALIDGPVIHVCPNMMMLLVDSDKIIDYTTEEGYYTVRDDFVPSMFNGSLRDTVAETLSRFELGGVTLQKQQVFYISLQGIKGVKSGTPASLNYLDNFYSAEPSLRAHENYSIKITDPLLSHTNAIPRNQTQVDINDTNEQYLAELITALQAAINQMSTDGQRISYVLSRSVELGKYMQTAFDGDWRTNRGMETVSVVIASISCTDDSTESIDIRNGGAILSDLGVREGYAQGSLARGTGIAGKNEGGAMSGLMDVGMGMNVNDNYFAQVSQTNQRQMREKQNQ